MLVNRKSTNPDKRIRENRKEEIVGDYYREKDCERLSTWGKGAKEERASRKGI